MSAAGTEPRTELVDLGPEAAFDHLPRRLLLAGRSYYLVSTGGVYSLLSTVCPHKGGEVVDAGACFECPRHGWRFDHQTGACLNAPAETLRALPVERYRGRLRVALPPEIRRRTHVATRRRRPASVRIALHAHACVELDYNGFSLVTDPWLHGPAFFGSWLLFPEPTVTAEELRPDAIWITHEHSDHFHEPTLQRLERGVPVYVPDFPNRRLVSRLAELGFENVTPLPFGAATEIGPDIRLTCFEPASLWNDSILLVEIGDFRFLNLNDAGLNRRVADFVAPVDVVASTFSPGASGYPLTWGHLGDGEKVGIVENARVGKLEMLRQAAELYGAEYVLPFASHFRLWHPSHRRYEAQLRRNTLGDVVAAFDADEATVLDLLPGEELDASTGERTYLWDRERVDDRGEGFRFLKRRWDPEEFALHHPLRATIGREDAEAYFLGLNEAPEMVFVEDLTLSVRAPFPDGSDQLELFFELRDQRLRIAPEPLASPDILIEVPAPILEQIVRAGVSWDEAHIGYWCRFDRSSDTYHAGFWRLLQAPYYRRPADLGPSAETEISASSAVADVLERYGPHADRILRRYGLYCLGCQHATSDTIAHAGKCHGVEPRQVERVVRELRAAVGGPGYARAPRRA